MARPSLLPHGWDDAAQASIVRDAGDGHTARQAGRTLGITKSAVLARANRTGVKFAPAAALISELCRKAGLASAAARRALKTLEPAHG